MLSDSTLHSTKTKAPTAKPTRTSAPSTKRLNNSNQLRSVTVKPTYVSGTKTAEFNDFGLVFIILIVAVLSLFGSVGARGRDGRRTRGAVSVGTFSTSYAYECHVGQVLKKWGYTNIQITQQSGDYGADIICKDKRGRRVAVQCKYYSKPVGYKAIEEALAWMHYYGCQVAMVVTNSTYTRQAEEAAARVGVVLHERVR